MDTFLDQLTFWIHKSIEKQEQKESIKHIKHLLHSWLAKGSYLCCLLSPLPLAGPSPRPSPTNDDAFCLHVTENRPLGEKGKIGVPYIVRVKDILHATDLVVKRTHVKDPFSFVLQPSNSIHPSCTQDSSQVWFGSHDFLNESLIGKLILHIWPPHFPAHFVRHYAAGLCKEKDVGLNLMKFSNGGTLESFPETFPQYVRRSRTGQHNMIVPRVVEDIIRQCTVAYALLEQLCEFAHGDAKPSNLFLTKQPCSYVWKTQLTSGRLVEIPVQSPFTCQVGDFGKASVEYQGVRFYPYNRLVSWIATLSPSSLSFPSPLQVQNVTYYQVHRVALQTIAQTRHMGGVYPKGFDLYSLLLGMFSIRDFFLSLDHSVRLQAIWNLLWKNSHDSNLVLERINKLSQQKGHHRVADVISTFSDRLLKCNLHEVLLQYFASSQDQSIVNDFETGFETGFDHCVNMGKKRDRKIPSQTPPYLHLIDP
jgi:hypothetical protein